MFRFESVAALMEQYNNLKCCYSAPTVNTVYVGKSFAEPYRWSSIVGGSSSIE